jgi:uncharacterized membrane protein
MKALEKIFGLTLLVLSYSALVMSAYLVYTRHYDAQDLGVIIVFCVPLLMAVLLSFTILTSKSK